MVAVAEEGGQGGSGICEGGKEDKEAGSGICKGSKEAGSGICVNMCWRWHICEYVKEARGLAVAYV